MQLNLTDSDEIFQTSNLRPFLNLTEISWRLAPLLQNHERISVCHCVSLSVSLCMLIWARKMTGFRWNYSILDWNECYNHRSCLKRFGGVCSCHHCQISRGLPKERAPFHKQWPLRPRLSSLRPEKRPTFCWWNVKMHFIQRQCCILTKFMLVTESTCNFLSTDMFLSKEQIYFRRNRVNANLIFNFSLMSDQAFAAWKASVWFS